MLISTFIKAVICVKSLKNSSHVRHGNCDLHCNITFGLMVVCCKQQFDGFEEKVQSIR